MPWGCASVSCPSAFAMLRDASASVLLIVSADELNWNSRVWGTGGWMPPEGREALDWLTLARLLGWEVDVCDVNLSGRLATRMTPSARVIIIACDPESLGEEAVDIISSRLANEQILVVTRVARQGCAFAKISAAFAEGDSVDTRTIEWRGPGPQRTTHFKTPFRVRRLSVADARIWAVAGEVPVAAARACGRGVVATLGFHPSAIRDAHPAGTAVIKNLLIWGSPGDVAWLDFDHTLVLRMDDPGGAQNVYSRTWSYPKLAARAWSEIGADLSARRARISLAYVSGWVDDADETRGRLTIRGQSVSRSPGAVYPSPLVRYEDVAGHSPGTVHDYDSEFSGIQALRRAGVADVELPRLHAHASRYGGLVSRSRSVRKLARHIMVSGVRERRRARARDSIGARSPARACSGPLSPVLRREADDVD